MQKSPRENQMDLDYLFTLALDQEHIRSHLTEIPNKFKSIPAFFPKTYLANVSPIYGDKIEESRTTMKDTANTDEQRRLARMVFAELGLESGAYYIRPSPVKNFALQYIINGKLYYLCCLDRIVCYDGDFKQIPAKKFDKVKVASCEGNKLRLYRLTDEAIKQVLEGENGFAAHRLNEDGMLKKLLYLFFKNPIQYVEGMDDLEFVRSLPKIDQYVPPENIDRKVETRLAQIDQYYSDKISFIDYGAGTGAVADKLAKEGHAAIVVDYPEWDGKANFTAIGEKVKRIDLPEGEWWEEKVDVIFIDYVLHHMNVEEREQFYANARESIGDEGFLIIKEHDASMGPDYFTMLHLLYNNTRGKVAYSKAEYLSDREWLEEFEANSLRLVDKTGPFGNNKLMIYVLKFYSDEGDEDEEDVDEEGDEDNKDDEGKYDSDESEKRKSGSKRVWVKKQ